MSEASARQPSEEQGESAPLCLRLTHNHGEARRVTLQIPASGTGMADALELSGERHGGAHWRLANMCRIAWRADRGHWQLLNGSYTLTCVLNGERVSGGCSVRIAEGDCLELGLLRFVVEQSNGEAAGIESIPREFHRSSPVEQDELSSFDLRDLAGDADGGSVAAAGLDGSFAAPFGMFSLTGDRPASSTPDVLSALLGDPARSLEQPQSGVIAPPASPRADGPRTLLEELYDEFVRVVRDPGELAGRADWEGLLTTELEPAPSLDDLRKQAEPYALLRDVLLPRKGIDRLIEEFEPLAPSGLLDTVEPDDVLGLFAPELARDAKKALPDLTRREHHAVSPDSHLRIGAARAELRNESEPG
jgi:hypothetical protein